MSLVFPTEGLLEWADKAVKDALSTDENQTLKLYKNNYTPTAADTSGSLPYTVADFTGYSNKTLTRSGWNAATTVSTSAQSVYGTTQTYSCSGGSQDIYGLFCLAATSGKILFAQKFPSVRTVASGDTLSLIPSITWGQG